MFTLCPHCRGPLEENVFFRAEKCPYCGHSFHGYSSGAALYLCAFFSILICVLIAWRARSAWPVAVLFSILLMSYGIAFKVIDLGLRKTAMRRTTCESTAGVLAIPVAMAVFLIAHTLLFGNH
jgi:hypothetical protein